MLNNFYAKCLMRSPREEKMVPDDAVMRRRGLFCLGDKVVGISRWGRGRRSP